MKCCGAIFHEDCYNRAIIVSRLQQCPYCNAKILKNSVQKYR